MKLSFDFDNTLSRKDVQDFAKKLVRDGHEVWIVTSRVDDKTANERAWWWIKDQNINLYNVAKECGIKEDNIKFTCGEIKVKFLEGEGFNFHLDDDDIELIEIFESGDSCKPINVENPDWLESCLEILKNNI